MIHGKTIHQLWSRFGSIYHAKNRLPFPIDKRQFVFVEKDDSIPIPEGGSSFIPGSSNRKEGISFIRFGIFGAEKELTLSRFLSLFDHP